MQCPVSGKRDPGRGSQALKDPVSVFQLGRSLQVRSLWVQRMCPLGACFFTTSATWEALSYGQWE